ncbi:MAG TPA: hypothetical protein VLM79_07210, partial [Kofleriaceae bacterium]|nr:hypothetical protein [Kofleriaceae bacterium]
TGLPPYIPGSNWNPFAASLTASSNTGCGGVTGSIFCTVPVASTVSFTVTTTGTVCAGAFDGYGTSVAPFARGGSNVGPGAALPAPAPLGGDGASGDGGLGDGAFGDGAFGDGALGDGALGDGALGDGALGDGGVGDAGCAGACLATARSVSSTGSVAPRFRRRASRAIAT